MTCRFGPLAKLKGNSFMDWEFYPSRVDDQLASIYVDLSYRDAAPLAEQSDVAWLRVFFLYPREDGLSSQEEFQALSDIEDALIASLDACGVPCCYVGRNTSAGCRDFYIYSGNGQMIESILGQAMVPFAAYECETGHRQDSEWS
jgi:hypothetical protein